MYHPTSQPSGVDLGEIIGSAFALALLFGGTVALLYLIEGFGGWL